VKKHRCARRADSLQEGVKTSVSLSPASIRDIVFLSPRCQQLIAALLFGCVCPSRVSHADAGMENI
jgi:hypothetical protein